MSEALNAMAKSWAEAVSSKLKAELSSQHVQATGKLQRIIKHSLKYHAGDVNRISWRVPRYGIMVEKGVGRGVGMKDGKRFDKSKNGNSLSRRKPKPWFSKVLDSELPKLADIVAKEKADQVVKSIKLTPKDGIGN